SDTTLQAEDSLSKISKDSSLTDNITDTTQAGGTGKNDSVILSEQQGKKVIFNISYEITASGNTDKIELITTLPQDYRFRQEINGYKFLPEDPEIFNSGENLYGRFIFIDPQGSYTINIKTDMIIYDYDLSTALCIDNFTPEPEEDLRIWLENEDYIEKDDSAIKAVAESFNSQNQVELIRQIYDFVKSSMQYSGYNPSSAGASAALKLGSGDCTEYSDLFVAICRAKKIPARTVEGYTTDNIPEKMTLGHNWPEVYFNEFGWVPFDIIYDDNNADSNATTFENLSNNYIYTGFIRNDSVLFNYHYYAYTYYGDSIKVIKRISAGKA
ncbi:MAG: transglutaminase domain-containing protein, partial [Actinobacteria bacterium]|nr:transglutaminase domain-containing protein [Actinomycetota bacterium]